MSTEQVEHLRQLDARLRKTVREIEAAERERDALMYILGELANKSKEGVDNGKETVV